MSEHAPTPDAIFGADFWDERYRSAQRVWSGNPNPQLVAEVAGRPPGRCGMARTHSTSPSPGRPDGQGSSPGDGRTVPPMRQHSPPSW